MPSLEKKLPKDKIRLVIVALFLGILFITLAYYLFLIFIGEAVAALFLQANDVTVRKGQPTSPLHQPLPRSTHKSSG